MIASPYLRHLRTSDDLVTTYEATRSGFISLALEKNRKAAPYIAEARALQEAAALARSPGDLLNVPNIEVGLLTAAGLSDKASVHLLPEDKTRAVKELIENFLEPAGAKFVEELVFRFLLTRGDALGGSVRNLGGALAQRKLNRAILSALAIAGIQYSWQHAKTRRWEAIPRVEPEIETSIRGVYWNIGDQPRTLIYNSSVPLINSNVDICLLNRAPEEIKISTAPSPHMYLAMGEIKGGIDPSGADEHWKTASAALERIREAFGNIGLSPNLFFVGAAVEKRMAREIWSQLQSGKLSNAANLNEDNQVASLSSWLISF